MKLLSLYWLRFVIGYLVFLFLASGCIKEVVTEKPVWLPEASHFLYDEEVSAVHFFVLSDWGFNGSDNQKQVAEQMKNVSDITGLDFIVTCGDNFQVAGVKSTEDLLWRTNYEQVYNDSSLLVPWFPALGNHDYMGNPQAQVDYTVINTEWKMPARYYSYVKQIDTLTSIRFIVLDTPGLLAEFDQLSDPSEFVNLQQYRWLKEVLAGSNEKWIVVTGHHPVFSAGSYHGDTKVMKAIIKPLFDEYGVDFYICGHDHDFEHAREEGSTVNYIVTGTGGEVRAVGSNDRTIFSLSSLGFTYISLSANTLKLYFINNNGEIAYNYVVKK